MNSDIMYELSQYKLDDKLLTPERLYYLEWHRNEFKKKAEKSKAEYEKYNVIPE